MEVIGHDLGASPRRLDGSGVDLEEFLRVDGAVVLLGQVGSELGGPIVPPQARRESPATGLVRADVVIGGGGIARGQAGGHLLVYGQAPPLPCSLSRAVWASSLAFIPLR